MDGEVRTIRADHVGSLIRPATLKAVRDRHINPSEATLLRARKPAALIDADDGLGRIVAIAREVWRS